MSGSSLKRRNFLKQTFSAGITLTAISANRVMGANDRVQVGVIGCGGRGTYHIGWLHRTAQEEPLGIAAVCDVWNRQRERAAAEVEKRFQKAPEAFADYRRLLERTDIDAVVIATCDHQHCGMLRDAIQSGKDAYVEKPIALELDDLNCTYDAVKASNRIVQHGTQGRTSKGAVAAKEFIQAGKLGKVLRVEESRSHYQPYWNHYPEPAQESDTDWQAFLYNRPYRPFNPDQHAHWMGYADFSSGTIGGWMSHLCDFTHYLLDSGIPVTATAQGGIYSPTSDPRRTCADTVTALLHYAEGFSLLFTTHFGNAANDYTKYFGTKGTMTITEPDGGIDGLMPRVSGEGSEHEEKVAQEIALENSIREEHMTNWIRCIRSRNQPNANMDAGYAQGVACILADRAYIEQRTMKFDPIKRTIGPV